MGKSINECNWRNPLNWEARRLYGDEITDEPSYLFEGFSDGYEGNVPTRFGFELRKGQSREDKESYAKGVEDGRMAKDKHGKLVGVLLSLHGRTSLPKELKEAIYSDFA
tara:strand:+ start:292 stop:618 length:327 start_codon:yes stop_codon:yes gene_type:complete